MFLFTAVQSSASVPPTVVPPSLHPAPPSLQHAPSSHPQSTSATVTGPPSLQAAPHVRPPLSAPQSVQGPPTMLQGPPQVPPGMTVNHSGIPPGHPGVPPGHPRQSHPGFPRHFIPGMVPQRPPEHGLPMMQRPGFPPMEQMPPGLLSRPPMLPHWMAPQQEYHSAAGQARRSPRPALPGMNTLARMGRPHLSMRPGVPHLAAGAFAPVSSAVQVSVGDQPLSSAATTHTPLEDPSQTTIQAGIPHSSPASSPFQPGPPSGQANPTMQSQSTTDSKHPQVEPPPAPDAVSKGDGKTITTQSSESSLVQDNTKTAVNESEDTAVGTEHLETEHAEGDREAAQLSEGSTETKDHSDVADQEPHAPQECTDGIHCGTPPPQQCTDGKHCGTPPPQECSDGLHCGTPPPQECTDGLHCGTPPPQKCTDGIHCGTPPPQECTDGHHCGTPPPQECTDGIHCGTPPPQECTDGIPQECTDGIHCGTPPPQECTDGLHCGTPPPQECTDGLHCGTPPPQECTDGLHYGTPPPQECTDGIHCGTPPPQECTDGLHCGTPPPQECTDGLHCGTPPPQECTDGLHCGTPPPQECTDGLHCGTPPPQECTDGLHCGTPPPQECADGLHCGTPPPQECTDGLHCGTPPPQECTDGLHCGTPPPQECSDGIHCGTPPPQACSDGIHCGTPPPQEQANNESQSSSQQQQGSSSEPPPPSSSEDQNLTVITTHDTPPPLQPAMLSPQQLAVQADHQYVNVSQPPVLLPSHSEEQDASERPTVSASTATSNIVTSCLETLPTSLPQNVPAVSQEPKVESLEPAVCANTSSQDQITKAPSEVPKAVVMEPAESEVSHHTEHTSSSASSVTAEADQPPSTTEQHIAVSPVQSVHHGAIVSKQEEDVLSSSEQGSEINTVRPKSEQIGSQDGTTNKTITEMPKPPTPVIEPVTSLTQSEDSGKVSPDEEPVDKIQAAVGQVHGTQQGTSIPLADEKLHPIQEPSSQLNGVVEMVETDSKVDKLEVDSGATEEKVDQHQTDVSAHAKSEASVLGNVGAASDSQNNTHSTVVSGPVTGESEVVSKPQVVPEIKTEVQATATTTVPSVSTSLTAVPRPRHFGPVGVLEEIPRPMFPAHMAGRLPYRGPVPGRHPGYPQDFRQQQETPPVSQPAGIPRHPQPAHFHESQLRFMQQMYQHQMAQGQRPQAAHLHQLQQGQPPYPVPPGYRGPMPGQPGFPPHFYPQYQAPNTAAPRLQHPSTGEAGTTVGHTVSKAQSVSPKARNLQRLPVPQPGHPGHVRHPGLPVHTEPMVQPRDPTSSSDTSVKLADATTRIPMQHTEAIPPVSEPVHIKQEPVDYQHATCGSETSKHSGSGPQSFGLLQQHGQLEKETTELKGIPMSGASHSPVEGYEEKPVVTSSDRLTTSADSNKGAVTVSSAGSVTASTVTSTQISQAKSSEVTSAIHTSLPIPASSPASGVNATVSVSQGQEPPSTSVSQADFQHHTGSAIPRPLSGNRQSPGYNQGHGRVNSAVDGVSESLTPSTAELTLPSVSATFAAAGMTIYGEGIHPGLPPYSQGPYRHNLSAPLSSHGPGFSSVSSIVQSVSSVSFPALGGAPAPQHHVADSVPAEVSLPPSTGVSSDAVSSVGASASTQTPVHHKLGPTPPTAQGQPMASAATTEHASVDVKPTIAGSTASGALPSGAHPPGAHLPGAQPPRLGHPYSDMQGAPGAPNMPGPHGPRMPVPSHTTAAQPTSQSGHVPRPRGPRQPQQHAAQASGMARYSRIPSNLPPHLAGMLNNMRSPMPARHMYPQERHPGMPPMGPMRFPPGSQGMMPMAPGGPGGYRMPVSQDGTQMAMSSAGPMQVPGGPARHPGMMPQGMPMRPGMRMVGPGGAMMPQHHMQPPHASQISPTSHPGAPPPPHMQQRMMHPATSAGPLMGPPGLPQPSGHPSPKEAQSPTQVLPQRPPTPGSMPSTPSPTSFHPGMMPMSSGAPSMAPGLPGEMHPRQRFPGQRMAMRMPVDGRIPFDPNMNATPRFSMEGGQRMAGFPPDFQTPGNAPNRPPHPEMPQSPSGPFEDPMRRMSGGKPGPSPTPPQSGLKSATPPAGSETTSASTTPPSPMVNIKQEQNLGMYCSH